MLTLRLTDSAADAAECQSELSSTLSGESILRLVDLRSRRMRPSLMSAFHPMRTLALCLLSTRCRH